MDTAVVPRVRHAWDQLDDETDIAYSRFRSYMIVPRGQRSIRKLAKQLDLTPGTIGELSSRNAWVERVRAWDGQLDEIEEQEFADAQRRMSRETARYAARAQQSSDGWLNAAIKGMTDFADPAKPDVKLGPRDALRASQISMAVSQGANRLIESKTRSVGVGGGGVTPAQMEGIGVGMSTYEMAELLIQLQPRELDDDGPGDTVIDVEVVEVSMGFEADDLT